MVERYRNNVTLTVQGFEPDWRRTENLFVKPAVELQLKQDFWMMFLVNSPRHFDIADDVTIVLPQKKIRLANKFAFNAVECCLNFQDRLIQDRTTIFYQYHGLF